MMACAAGVGQTLSALLGDSAWVCALEVYQYQAQTQLLFCARLHSRSPGQMACGLKHQDHGGRCCFYCLINVASFLCRLRALAQMLCLALRSSATCPVSLIELRVCSYSVSVLPLRGDMARVSGS